MLKDILISMIIWVVVGCGNGSAVETLVQKKTGSAGWKMVLLRFTCSFIAAAVLNLILPGI